MEDKGVFGAKENFLDIRLLSNEEKNNTYILRFRSKMSLINNKYVVIRIFTKR